MASNSGTRPKEPEHQIFNKFLKDFSDFFKGTELLKLQFLLSDHLTVKNLHVNDNTVGKPWLDELSEKKSEVCVGHLVISPKRLNLLWEIADITKRHFAEQRVYEYMKQIKLTQLEGEGIMGYRKIMYNGLMESTPGDFEQVVAYYKLSCYKQSFDNSIWKAVARVEENEEIVVKEQFYTFGNLLNRRAYKIFEDGSKRFQGPKNEDRLKKLKLPLTQEEQDNKDKAIAIGLGLRYRKINTTILTIVTWLTSICISLVFPLAEWMLQQFGILEHDNQHNNISKVLSVAMSFVFFTLYNIFSTFKSLSITKNIIISIVLIIIFRIACYIFPFTEIKIFMSFNRAGSISNTSSNNYLFRII